MRNYTESLCHVLDHLRATRGQWTTTDAGCIRHVSDGLTCPLVASTGRTGDDADSAGTAAGLDPSAVNAWIGALDCLPDHDPDLRREAIKAAGLTEILATNAKEHA